MQTIAQKNQTKTVKSMGFNFFLNEGQNIHTCKVYLYLCYHFAVDFTGNNMKLGDFLYQAYFHSK